MSDENLPYWQDVYISLASGQVRELRNIHNSSVVQLKEAFERYYKDPNEKVRYYNTFYIGPNVSQLLIDFSQVVMIDSERTKYPDLGK